MQENSQQLTFHSFSKELAPYFNSINSEWINEMFYLEDVDKYVLENPKVNIIDKGGNIWFAEHSELGVLGTCAIKKMTDGSFELTKMGVLQKSRGLKVGEKLLQHVLEESKKLKMRPLFLITNTKCESAIHLYEKNGFIHDPMLLEKYKDSYERANVAMSFIDF
jgi:N-acetylglutamate synthase-like GNAT family acetyltransferase